MKATDRPFMAELQRSKRSVKPGEPPEDRLAARLAAPMAVDNREVLAAVAEVSAKLDRFLNLDHDAIERVQVEIADIAGRIKATKREMANLRHPLASEDKLQQASEELQSVVSHTEIATNKIMAAAETIDEIMHELKAQAGDYHQTRLTDMHEAILRIYESCNFQDLTGQRINRVVRTLAFIEERVDAMMGLWSRQEFEAMPLPTTSIIKNDGDLELTGPSGAGEAGHISQSDIDALFD